MAVGLLTLSGVSLQRTNAGRGHAIAQANARLSLQLALAQLQNYAGADTRVTAPAAALSGVDGAQQLYGAWRSWEGDDHDASGFPIQPDYDAKLDDASTAGGNGKFLGWLISGVEGQKPANTPPTLEKGIDTVALLSEGTLSTGSNMEVHLPPTFVNDEGAYAWWIQGENSKAMVMPSDDEPEGAWDWSKRLATAGRANPEVFGIEDGGDLDKVVTRHTLNLSASSGSEATNPASEYFHDLTSMSRGLLTNTATGGWRRDLSLMVENFTSLSDGDLPFFGLTPGEETSASKTHNQQGGLIYPWTGVPDTALGSRLVGPCMSWSALVDFATKYKDMDASSSSEKPVFALADVFSNAGRSDMMSHSLLMTRIHWVFSFSSLESGKNSDGETTYTPYIVAQPLVTLWNPYNVGLEINNSFTIQSFSKNAPLKFDFTVGTTEVNNVNMAAITAGKIQHSNNNNSNESGAATLTIRADLCDEKIWRPGECRVFSGQGEAVVAGSSNSTLYPGFRNRGGFRYEVKRTNSSIQGQASDKFYAVVDFDNTTTNSSDSATITSVVSFGQKVAWDSGYWMNVDQNDLRNSYSIPPIENDDETLGSVSGSGNEDPFMVAIFGLKNTEAVTVQSKGYHETKAIVPGMTNDRSYENSPYDWQYYPVNGWLDDSLASSDDDLAPGDDEAGFLGTSFRSDVGLTRLSTHEIPVRPLISLGDLQHFDIAFNNSVAPRISNPIGNSHASALIAPQSVHYTDDSPASDIMGLDHSYLSNHLFFDDWFVSSIAPETDDWSAGINRSVVEVYRNHLTGAMPLPNSHYLPATPAPDESTAATLASDHLDANDAWRHIASELEVEGMFNVNSTSITAWSAVLQHLMDAQVPQLEVGQSDWAVELEQSDGVAVTRTTVSSDERNAGSGGSEVLATHKRLTEEQIEALAEAIVEQVRERGPFLSLSEFVNRRLDANDLDLAKAGAIEAAILSLSEESGSGAVLNTEILSSGFGNSVEPFQDPNEVYEFPEAAEGSRAYGYPGWIRQADILRPLAPMLSVRDDTFVIRSYGDYRNPENGEIEARAWCEAIVQRKANFVDPADDKNVLPGEQTLSSEANLTMGRRFEIVSFRWLTADEV
ncbi:MAG: hypothetical protein ACQKBU_04130 [Verrucomicrobiales bacterium]